MRPLSLDAEAERPTPRGPADRVVLVALGVIIFAAAVLAVLQLREGHDWGDDFALYIDQARALAEGDVDAVVARTRYSIENSSWSSFSPRAYPWGFPLLLVPAYWAFGVDLTAFKAMQVVFLLGFLTAFAALVRPRLRPLSTVLLVAFVAVNQAWLSWVNSVLSDLPFTCVTTVALLAIERAFAPGRFTSGRRGPPWWAIGGVGLLIASSMLIRREGLLLVVALAARQVVTAWRAGGDRAGLAVPYAVPYAVVAAVTAVARMALPAPGSNDLTQSGGLSLRGHWEANVTFYRPLISDVLGVRGWVSDHTATAVLVCLLAFAIAGVALRLVEDPAMAVTFVGYGVLYLALPFQEGRYLFLVVPLGLYFAFRLADELALPRLTLQPAHLVALLFLALATRTTAIAVDYWHTYPDAVPGPHSPAAQEAFTAVRRLTDEDDVVAFFRARAMNLFGDRQGVQLTSLAHILERADWYLMERGSTYSQCLIGDAEAAATGRMSKAFENGVDGAGWVLWRIDRSSSLGPADVAALPPCRV